MCLYTTIEQTPGVGGLKMGLCQDTDMLKLSKESGPLS